MIAYLLGGDGGGGGGRRGLLHRQHQRLARVVLAQDLLGFRSAKLLLLLVLHYTTLYAGTV